MYGKILPLLTLAYITYRYARRSKKYYLHLDLAFINPSDRYNFFTEENESEDEFDEELSNYEIQQKINDSLLFSDQMITEEEMDCIFD